MYLLHTYVGEPNIQPPQSSASIFPTSISLTCGEDVSVTSLVKIRVIRFICSIFNGLQPLTWKVYKDGELMQYNSVPVVINNPTESDYGTYTFVLLSTHCGATSAVSRLLQQGQFIHLYKHVYMMKS